MTEFNFDKIVDRKNTSAVKHDLLEPLFGSKDLIPLWVADMDFESPNCVREALESRMRHEVYGYSIRGNGYHQAIVNWLESRHHWKVAKTELSFSPGVVPGLLTAMLALTNPGDKVVVQPPVYYPFFTMVAKNGRQLVYNELINNDGFYMMDFEGLAKEIKNGAKMVVISNPHNPVGRAWDKDELEMLVEICHENGVIILSDEIHSDLVFEPKQHIPLASISDKAADITVTFMAPSKTFNVAGLSTSFVVFKNSGLKKMYEETIEGMHLNIGNIFGTIASEAAYTKGAKWLDALKIYLVSNINYTETFIQHRFPHAKVIKPEATYLMWLDFREYGLNDEELFEIFSRKAGIAVNRGDSFGPGGNGFVRMNIASPKAVLKKAFTGLDSLEI